MSELKSWYDFCAEKQRTPKGCDLTAIACPCCGRALYKDISVVMTLDPPKYRYFCNACGWFDWA